MKLFKAEDFAPLDTQEDHARNANALLEKNCRIVYGNNSDSSNAWSEIQYSDSDTHQAILINIQPIQKCIHSKEKVDYIGPNLYDRGSGDYFLCECGMKVSPIGFEEV